MQTIQWCLAWVILAACSQGRTNAAQAFDQTHSALGVVLSRFVKAGLVDYRGLKSDPADLKRYLDQVSEVSEQEYASWGAREQVAFLCNVYNASTLQLVIDAYPIRSIRDIGFLPHAAWRKEVVRVFGRTTSLEWIEHDQLRARFPEQPGVHFALVCAARGCPPLRSEPYIGKRLQAQLDEQARKFMADTTKNRVIAVRRTVQLSRIFKWYEEDFTRTGTGVLDYVQRFFPRDAQQDLSAGGFRIEYTDYDWSLNDQAPPRP
jgi:hypothetical protein